MKSEIISVLPRIYFILSSYINLKPISSYTLLRFLIMKIRLDFKTFEKIGRYFLIGYIMRLNIFYLHRTVLKWTSLVRDNLC